MCKERIEGTTLAVVRKMHVCNIVRNRIFVGGRCEYLRCRNVKELRVGIDEPRDEPGTCDAIDLRPFARDPARRGAARLRIDGAVRRDPCGETTREVMCAKTAPEQCGRGALAH